MVPDRMLAARVHVQGGPDFHLDLVPVPEPGPGQILVRVESASVNFSDVKRRRGDPYPFDTAFPFVPGGEIAGTAAALGPGVDGPPVGTRVFAFAGPNGYGGYAQFAVAYANAAVPIPDALDFDGASTLIVAGTTARFMLTLTARVQPGESVLVPAATGGVGSFAVQIARALGARVIAAVGHPDKTGAALALGAHDVVVYTEPDWPARVRILTDGRGVDVALEASGGDALRETFSALAPFGRLVVFGAASGVSASLDPATMDTWLYTPGANQSIASFNINTWFVERPQDAGPALMALVDDASTGRLRLPDIRTLPLRDAREAHLALEARHTIGKIVLKPWQE